MPASAAFSVVAEDSNFTPCGVDLWFESRAWILPLRSIVAPLQRNAWIRHLFCKMYRFATPKRKAGHGHRQCDASPLYILCCFSAENSLLLFSREKHL